MESKGHFLLIRVSSDSQTIICVVKLIWLYTKPGDITIDIGGKVARTTDLIQLSTSDALQIRYLVFSTIYAWMVGIGRFERSV